MKEVTKLYTKRHITEALRTCNGPNITEILGLAISKEVLVQRENKRQDGLYIMLLIDGYDCMIKLPSGPIVFCVTSIKKYYCESLLILLIAQNTPTLVVTNLLTLMTNQEL